MALFALLAMPAGVAQIGDAIPDAPPFFVRSNYTKQEYHVSMRDGVKLFTQVYAPRENHGPYPILLLRTPYSVAPYGATNYRTTLGPSDSLAREGIIYVYQDGRVGVWGASFPGFYAAFRLINSHRALKSDSPQAPMGDVGNGDDAYHNGA